MQRWENHPPDSYRSVPGAQSHESNKISEHLASVLQKARETLSSTRAESGQPSGTTDSPTRHVEALRNGNTSSTYQSLIADLKSERTGERRFAETPPSTPERPINSTEFHSSRSSRPSSDQKNPTLASESQTDDENQKPDGKPNLDEITTIRDQLIECFDIGFNLFVRIAESKRGIDNTLGMEMWYTVRYLVDRIIEAVSPQPQVLMDVAINLEREPRYLSKFLHTCFLAINTGIGLGYPPDTLSALGVSAFLHDIGLFELPKAILQGAKQLTDQEFAQMKQHTILGVRKLRSLVGDQVSQGILAGIYQHHERIDGSGYPEQRTQEGIHEFAQIIGIANAYEAITHKKQKAPHEAMREIIGLGGTWYSRKITRIFVNQAAIFPVGSLVMLTNKEIAKVVVANKDYPLRPIVLTLIDRKYQKVKTPAVLDLRYMMNLNVDSTKPIRPEDIGIDRRDILYATGHLEGQNLEPIYVPEEVFADTPISAERTENRDEPAPHDEITPQREDVVESETVNRSSSEPSAAPEIDEDNLYEQAEQQLRAMLTSWPANKPIPNMYVRAQVKKLKAERGIP